MYHFMELLSGIRWPIKKGRKVGREGEKGTGGSEGEGRKNSNSKATLFMIL